MSDAVSQELIRELMKEADADEAKAKALLAAAADKRTTARVLQARLKQPAGQSSETQSPEQSFLDLSLVERLTITDRVTRTVKSMRSRQITVSGVHDELQALGLTLPQDIRARISTVLNRLEGRGVLMKIAQGAGSTPNVYKLTEQGAQAA